MSDARPDSYWLDTAPAFRGGAVGGVEGRVDVAIVGGGFTGLSAALALAKRGASVAVLEAGRIVGEASGRNGGQCNNGLAHDYASLAASLGKERAKAYYRAYCDAVDTVERIAREEAIDCAFERCGRIKLAAKPSHFEKLAKAYEALVAEVDPNVKLVPPDMIGDEVGSDSFHGGLVQTTSARLHVGKFGVGLAEAAARHGAHIWEKATVTDLRRRPDGWRVVTPRGNLEAKQILVATGGTGAGPFGWFRRRIVPVGSFVIATEPLETGQLDMLFPTRRNYVTSRLIGNYFRIAPDNRLIFGGRARFAMSNPRSDRKGGAILRTAMTDMFPELKDIRIDYVWGGQVDMSADRLPRAGERDGMFYSMGYSGHGVQMSVHMGPILADMMEGRADTNPWGDLDWPAVPGHFGKPWFLPVVGVYYRMQDALN